MSEVLDRFRPLFHPRSITFVGASKHPGKWGHIVLQNLINGGFAGSIYPVNPREEEILNLRVRRSVAEVPEASDLAVVVTPPPTVPAVLQDCVNKGIRAALVISAGFAEVGEQGRALQTQMAHIARKGNLVILGPNSNGIMSPRSRLYPTMPPLVPEAGPMALVSQSGNVGISIVSRAMMKGLGFSYYASSGNEAQQGVTDLMEFYGKDPDVRAICTYVEGVKDGRRFLDVAEQVTCRKPVVMLKVGHTDAGARAALSHTASLSGFRPIFSHAAKRAGILLADNIDELFNITAAFIRQPLPKGRRVGIVTSGGGWGVIGADACARAGLDVVPLPEETISRLDRVLPPWWSRGNPVDLVAGMREGDMEYSIKTLLECPVVDALLLLGMRSGALGKEGKPATMLDSMTAVDGPFYHRLTQLLDEQGKPIILAADSAFGEVDTAGPLGKVLGQEGLVCYSLPDHGAVVLSKLADYADYLKTHRR